MKLQLPPIPPTPIHSEKTPSLVIKKKRAVVNHEIQLCIQIGWSWMSEGGSAGLF